MYLRFLPAVLGPMLLMPLGAWAQVTPKPQPGELPNSQSAPPLTIQEKYDYRVIETFGFRGFLGAAIGAGIGQGLNTPGAWGQGVEGYTIRYISGFGSLVTRQSMAFVLDSAFHEDPRYFPSEDRSFKARSWNAIKQTVICKRDSGKAEIAYSRIFSAVANGQLVNAWQPAPNATVGDGFKRSGIQLGSDLGMNLLQEFVPFTRPRSLRNRH